MIRLALVLAAAVAVARAAATAAQPASRPVTPRVYLGAADASAAVRLGDASILVADDEDNVLRLYDVEQGGMPRATLDLSTFLGLDRNDEADIEAAVRVGGRVYWITSHGPNRKGKLLENRQRFFAITVARESGDPVLRPFGRPCSGLLPALRRALEGVSPADGQADLNIEALASGPDERTLWIGLRAPLGAPDGAAHAIVVPLGNASAVVERGDAPELGQPILWDLGGRALRDMFWSASRRQLLVLAGAEDRTDGWGLYRWSGTSGDPPQALSAEWPTPRDFQPEALVEREAGGRLLVLSDDGDRPVAVRGPDECTRGNYQPDGTCPNKRLKDASRKSFRGFELSP